MAAAHPQITFLVEHDIKATEDEVEAYAGWVGIDVEFERDLFHLARDGIEAKLPEGWQACIRSDRPDAEIFYWHAESRKSTWQHPMDDVYRQKVVEAREQRRCRIITLNLSTSPEGLALVGTNLAGEEVVSVPCSENDVFATVEDKLRALAQEDAVLCFAKMDGTLVGHSSRAHPVTHLFA